MSQLAELRQNVHNEINKLFKKESSVAIVNAAHGGLGKIIASLNSEMQYAKATNRKPEIPYMEGE